MAMTLEHSSLFSFLGYLFASSHRGPSIVNRRVRVVTSSTTSSFSSLLFLLSSDGEDGESSNVRVRVFERGTVGIVYSSNRQLTDIMFDCLRLR